ncbi:unnamed protein product, partial [Oikopleura dioica]
YSFLSFRKKAKFHKKNRDFLRYTYDYIGKMSNASILSLSLSEFYLERTVSTSLNQTVEQVNAATEEIDNDSFGFFMLWGVVFSLIVIGIVLESIKKLSAKKAASKSQDCDIESTTEDSSVTMEEVEIE